MTTFTMRYIKGHFVLTGPDVPPMQFKRVPKPGNGARRIILARLSTRSGWVRETEKYKGRRRGSSVS